MTAHPGIDRLKGSIIVVALIGLLIATRYEFRPLGGSTSYSINRLVPIALLYFPRLIYISFETLHLLNTFSWMFSDEVLIR